MIDGRLLRMAQCWMAYSYCSPTSSKSTFIREIFLPPTSTSMQTPNGSADRVTLAMIFGGMPGHIAGIMKRVRHVSPGGLVLHDRYV